MSFTRPPSDADARRSPRPGMVWSAPPRRVPAPGRQCCCHLLRALSLECPALHGGGGGGGGGRPGAALGRTRAREQADHLGLRGPHREKMRAGEFRAEVVRGERLPANMDVHSLAVLCPSTVRGSFYMPQWGQRAVSQYILYNSSQSLVARAPASPPPWEASRLEVAGPGASTGGGLLLNF